MVVLLAGTCAQAGNYDVDISNAPNLGAVPGDKVLDVDAGTPLTNPFDATRVQTGNEHWIISTGKTIDASRLSVESGGTLNFGFDHAGDASDGYIYINVVDNGVRQNFTVGSASGTGYVNLGNANTDMAVTIVGGKLDIVDGDIAYDYDTASGVAVTMQFDSMEFKKGVVTMHDANTRLTIGGGGAIIGHGTASADKAELHVSSGATFTGGLTMRRGGLLQASAGTTNVSFGNSGRLVMEGGVIDANGGTLNLATKTIVVENVEGVASVIDVTGGRIVFASDVDMTVRGDLDVTGANNAIALMTYTQEAGAVTVTGAGGLTVLTTAKINGGTFQSEASTFTGGLDLAGGARLLHGSVSIGTDSLLRVGRTAFIDVTGGNLEVLGDGGVEIYGTLLVGADGGQSWRLEAMDADAGITFMDGSAIELSEDFINRLDGTNYLGTVVARVGSGGEIVLPGDKNELAFDNFLYGEYTYTLNDSKELVLSSYFTGIDRDGTQADYEWAERLLSEKYGALVSKTDGFALNIYKSAVREDAVGVVPYDRLKASAAALVEDSAAEQSYLMNLANLQAFAKGSEAALDGSLAGMYSGINNSGVVDVAISTAGAVVDHVKMRLRDLNATRLDMGETYCPGDALPSFVLDSDYAGRIWFGGFGMLENAGTREEMPGYRYEPGGFIGGYDYAVDTFGFGLVYAYAKGDFADKTALRHDSKIASHTVGAHASYFDPSGFYISGMAGYGYSSNDIAELRSDASVTGGRSWNRAEYNGHTLHGALEIGYEFRDCSGFTITPTLGLTYIYSEATDHDERLGDALAGRIRGVKNSATYVPVRVEAGYEICTGAESRLKLTANAGYAYRFDGDGIEGTFDLAGFSNAITHRVAGREAGHHSFNLGAGARFHTERFDIGVKYDYYGMADYSAHRLMATAGFSF